MTICVGNEAQDDNLRGNDMESVMAEIGVALIGFGLAGQVFHAPFVSAVPGLRLEAIVQRKGDEAARAYPSARILRTVDEALRIRRCSWLWWGRRMRRTSRWRSRLCWRESMW